MPRHIVRTWFVLGTPYPVVRTDEVDKDLDGEYHVDHGEIRVNETVPPHRFWSVESHELGHVVAAEMGIKETLRETFGLSNAVAGQIEEEWIARFLPTYLDTLERNGYLVAPRNSGGGE